MRRLLLLTALLLAGSPAAAQAASVKLLDCVPALDAHDRAATFEARMGLRRGSERMQLRFTLQIREPGRFGWRRVAAPGLDQWLAPDPGVRRYSYAKTLRNLSAPAAYRMVVRFRWLGPERDVLARSRATSRLCRQPDMRPDLRVARIELGPALGPEARSYAVTVHNAGRSAAGELSVALRVGDEPLAPVAVAGLAAGERRIVVFGAHACAGGEPLAATVDPDAAVAESDEDDNSSSVACQP